MTAMSAKRLMATMSSTRTTTRATIAANSVANGVVDIDFSGGGAVTEIVEVCIDDFEILLIAADERAQAHVGRSEVDDDNLSDQVQEERRWLSR